MKLEEKTCRAGVLEPLAVRELGRLIISIQTYSGFWTTSILGGNLNDRGLPGWTEIPTTIMNLRRLVLILILALSTLA